MATASESDQALREELEALDAALGRLRRLWESPPIRRWFEERLGEAVDPTLFRTLRAVQRAGEEPRVRDLAAELGVDGSTASRLVDQAVCRGYVSRATAQEDRRRAALSLTAEGDALLQRVAAARAELLVEFTSGWTTEEVRTLVALLGRLARPVRLQPSEPA